MAQNQDDEIVRGPAYKTFKKPVSAGEYDK